MTHEQTARPDRYHRQRLIKSIGDAGQERLRETSALLVGCGALGTVMADQLVRAGMGRLVIVDRDIVELTNLQRQVLFDEDDVEAMKPKATAAKAKLERINQEARIEAHIDDFNAHNAERLSSGVDLLLDGLDNFQTRYLLNDLAVARGLPYVYGGAVGTNGMGMVILPRKQHRRNGEDVQRINWSDDRAGPCLRCLFPDPPPAGTSDTCDTVGVLASVVNIIASWQSLQAIKLITGKLCALDRTLVSFDGWRNEWQRFEMSRAVEASCPCCGEGRFDAIDNANDGLTTSLCGRDAVQIIPRSRADADANGLDLNAMAERLRPHGEFVISDALLRGTFTNERNQNGQPIRLLLFATGRAIIQHVDRPELARTMYSRYIGD